MLDHAHGVAARPQRVSLTDRFRGLLFYLLKQQGRHLMTADDAANNQRLIERERRYLSERIRLKPGTAYILERILVDLYADARQQILISPWNSAPPARCPYTLVSLLQPVH